MKIVTLDIETSPNLAHVWALFNQNVGINQIMESAEVMCFAAKWYDSKAIHFYSSYHHGKERMLEEAYKILDEADVVVHYNGAKFDIPHLNRELLTANYEPPSPYAQVDLLQVVKKQFRFPSNKLDYVCQALNLGEKQGHTGHQLWVDCLTGSGRAWNLMRKYNRQDVVITERLYDKLQLWIKSHPSAGLYNGIEDSCPSCGSTELKPRGRAYTALSVFQRYRCEDCGKWSRGNKRIESTNIRGL